MITVKAAPRLITIDAGHFGIVHMNIIKARELQRTLNTLLPLEALQLTLGGTYTARNGTIHGPLSAHPDPNYPFTAGNGINWTPNGYRMGSYHLDPLDLVIPTPERKSA